MWRNELSSDGETLQEIARNEEGMNSLLSQRENWTRGTITETLIFGKRAYNAQYKYVGTFVADLESYEQDRLIFKRIRECEALPPQMEQH